MLTIMFSIYNYIYICCFVSKTRFTQRLVEDVPVDSLRQRILAEFGRPGKNRGPGLKR